MTISPDDYVFWEWGCLRLNATIVFTWIIVAILTVGSRSVTRRLSDGIEISPWQNLVEVLVSGIRDQISDISQRNPTRFLPFVGTLFIFIAAANVLNVVPGYVAPTGSLSTTTALAICAFVAVPVYGITEAGWANYLKHYVQPNVLMLPFNLIGEMSRTVALAVRLYGNIMSGTVIVAILLGLTPYFFPLVLQFLGLLTGMIQAYIFSVLAMVYIASATQSQAQTQQHPHPPTSA